MPAGKLSAQAGHAFLNAYLASLKTDPSIADMYQSSGLGTKVCLYAKNEDHILHVLGSVERANLPHSLIIDSGHIMPPFFDGSPIITAIGIGPCTRSTIQHITTNLKLV